MTTLTIPAPLARLGVAALRELDVRPILAKGGDPFQLIMRTVAGLGAGEAVALVVGFEPLPLISVMRAKGYAAHTERAGDAFHVFFTRDPEAREAPEPAERVSLRPPLDLDVRGLEPPAPMVAILEKLAELGPGADLRVRHHREPVLLYDKLAARGFAARAAKEPDGDFLIRIAPAWALDDEKAEGRTRP